MKIQNNNKKINKKNYNYIRNLFGVNGGFFISSLQRFTNLSRKKNNYSNVKNKGNNYTDLTFKGMHYRVRRTAVWIVSIIFILGVIGTPTLMAMAASELYYPSYWNLLRKK